MEIRLGVAGLGHRGRHMFKVSADSFDFIVPAGACDIKPSNWYETQWISDKPFSEYFPDTQLI